MIGTPAYSDDRIVDGLTYDLSADVYSLGMIFLFIFKGAGIFDNCSDVA
jgi:hypothetical protein